jgi:RNA polymerase sigma factor (sigma-70 family)
LNPSTKDIHFDLIEQCKNGSVKAEYEIYKLYSKAMYNTCMRLLNNREDAEDILQEVFIYAFNKLKNFRFEASFGSWLKQITVNSCINKLKKKSVLLTYPDDFNAIETGFENENDIQIEYEAKKILRAAEKLPEGFRVVFSLYLLEGYDHAEISQILGIAESTSKTQYMRAKLKIKELLK